MQLTHRQCVILRRSPWRLSVVLFGACGALDHLYGRGDDRQTQLERRPQCGCGAPSCRSADALMNARALPVLPLTFELSFDNFHTVRKCRLILGGGRAFFLRRRSKKTTNKT